MYRVTYTSRASRIFTSATLAAINAVSRRNNSAFGVSGLLVYHDRLFFQVLEGEEAVLIRLMEKIAKDPRHLGLDIVAHGPIEQRAFTTWRLCCAPEGPQACAGSAVLQDLVPANSDLRGRDPEVRRHVRTFLSRLQHLPTAAAG